MNLSMNFIIPLLLSTAVFAQSDDVDFPLIQHDFKPLIRRLKNVQTTAGENLNKPSAQNEWVIGQTDPNEVATITGSYVHQGDIKIVNNGVLNLNNADFQIDGDILIVNAGRMNVNGGSFTVIQEYIYEHEAVVWQHAQLYFKGVDFRSSGQSWSLAIGGDARYIIEDSEISDGFITNSLVDNGSARIENTKIPGEFICFGKNDLTFRNSDFVLMWLALEDSSVVDMALPEDSLLTGWRFSNAEPGVAGVPYTVAIDSCTNVQWGLISKPGSDGIFRDTKFRVAGMLFDRPEPLVVQNITNGSRHDDDVIAVPDRNLRLVNSEVATWNFYPAGSANVTVQNCIFGELISGDSAFVQIDNSVCDGSGGYLGAFGHSITIVFRSIISTQVIAREKGVLVGALSAFTGPEVDADDSAIMAILNTSTYAEPEAHNNAMIFEGQLPPVEGFVASEIAIRGTARIIAGPLNPIQLTGFKVEYAVDFANPAWRPTDGLHSDPVNDDTLAMWNTSGLSQGAYILQLTLFHSYGDSMAIASPARLQDMATGVPGEDEHAVRRYALAQNYPNPFNPSTTIEYQLSNSGHVMLRILNAMGQDVCTLVDENKAAGHYYATWNGKDDFGKEAAGGVYFLQLKANEFVQTRKLLLLK